MWLDEECFTNSLFNRYLMSFIYLFPYFLILLIIVTFYEHRKVKYKTFFSWIDQILSNKLPKGIVAFNFNLYEGKDSYHIQLIGASSFSETNSDWPCDELFSTGEDVFVVETKLAGSHWQDALSYCKKMISDYLKFGQKRNVLLSSKAVGMGFADGDLIILYKTSTSLN